MRYACATHALALIKALCARCSILEAEAYAVFLFLFFIFFSSCSSKLEAEAYAAFLAGALYVQQEKSWDIGTLSLFFFFKRFLFLFSDFFFSSSLWVCHILAVMCGFFFICS